MRRLGSIVGPLQRARLRSVQPGAGDGHKAQQHRRLTGCAPGRALLVRGRPRRGGRIPPTSFVYPIRFRGYRSPRCAGCAGGEPGFSLHGHAYLTECRHGRASRLGRVPGSVATPGDICTPPARHRSGVSCIEKAAVVVTHNSGRDFALSNGGCSPRNELVRSSASPENSRRGPLQQPVRVTIIIPRGAYSVNPPDIGGWVMSTVYTVDFSFPCPQRDRGRAKATATGRGATKRSGPEGPPHFVAPAPAAAAAEPQTPKSAGGPGAVKSGRLRPP